MRPMARRAARKILSGSATGAAVFLHEERHFFHSAGRLDRHFQKCLERVVTNLIIGAFGIKAVAFRGPLANLTRQGPCQFARLMEVVYRQVVTKAVTCEGEDQRANSLANCKPCRRRLHGFQSQNPDAVFRYSDRPQGENWEKG